MAEQFTVEEAAIEQKISDMYNSGHCDKAVEMSIEFLKTHPESILAQYMHAVISAWSSLFKSWKARSLLSLRGGFDGSAEKVKTWGSC